MPSDTPKPQICFVIEEGLAMPCMPRVPDGRRYLSVEQASEITGKSIDRLRDLFASTFGDLSPEALAQPATLPVTPPDSPAEAAGPAAGSSRGDDTPAAERVESAEPSEPSEPFEPSRIVVPCGVHAAEPTDYRDLVARQCYFPGLGDEDWDFVKKFCRMRQLDWTRRHVFAERRWDELIGDNKLFVMLTIDGFRYEAGRTGLYGGVDETQFVFDDLDRPLKAVTTVYRKPFPGSTDRGDPFVGYAYWNDFYPPGARGERFAEEKPHVMLGKCSRVAALREAFWESLAGLYLSEELGGGGGGRRPRRDPPPDPRFSDRSDPGHPAGGQRLVPTAEHRFRDVSEIIGEGYATVGGGVERTGEDGEQVGDQADGREVVSLQTFMVALVEMGVTDREDRERILRVARTRLRHLAYREDAEALFYSRAIDDVRRNRRVYGIDPVAA